MVIIKGLLILISLKQINALRKSIEAKAEEYERDMERVQKMYAQPSEPAV